MAHLDVKSAFRANAARPILSLQVFKLGQQISHFALFRKSSLRFRQDRVDRSPESSPISRPLRQI
jgi:hypothetical protein